MANINLIQKIKCLSLVSLSNLTLTIDFSSLLNSAIGLAEGFAATIVASIKGAVTSTIASATAELAAIEAEIFAAYDTVTELVKDVQSLTGIFTASCSDAAINNPKFPTINVIANITSLPNHNTIKSSEDSIIKGEMLVAKNQSITKVATVIGNIDQKLPEKSIQEKREYVRLYKDLHPVLDSYVNKLNYFQPISEEVGAAFIAYTLDKPSLQLKDWSTTTPQAIRKNIVPKIRTEINSEIETAYDVLNEKFASNISDEFYLERSVPFNTAHSYHIAGDSLFYVDHIASATLMTDVMKNFAGEFGDQASLVNYITPITEARKIENDSYQVEQEETTVNIDKRGNIVRKPFTVVDNDSLNPTEQEDV